MGSQNVGVAHFLSADGDADKQALESSGTNVLVVREVLVQRLKQNVPDQLGMLNHRNADAGVHIRLLYSDYDHQLVLVVDDFEEGKVVSDPWLMESHV